jgi:hypothetical protein
MLPSNLTSRAYRLCHLYAIKPAEGPIEQFTPNEAQKHYYNRLHTCNHILKARKLGFSTFNMIDATDAMLFYPGTEVGIIDYSLPDAKKKLAMIKTAYDNLDNPRIHPADQAKWGRAFKRSVTMRYSKTEIQFSNGSSAYCGTSLRGSTPNRHYISELGKTSIFAPIKAKEIREGALNALTPGNLIVIESTHEGGKFGLHYEMLETCMAHDDNALSPIDFRFHFFPWWLDDRYIIADEKPLRPTIEDYFQKLEPHRAAFCAQHGFAYRPLTHHQKRWYDAKESTQRHGMKKEFPSLPGEAFEAPNDNAIYGTYMADIRASGRVTDFTPDPYRPLFTFWDIGVSDFTSLWLIQFNGPRLLWCNWYENAGHPGGHYVDTIRRWEAHYQRPITRHYVPHDAAIRDKFSATTYADALRAAGLQNVIIVPRTPDKWNGINEIRRLLPNSYFHKTYCDTPRIKDGEKFPSGVACLEGYQRRLARDGMTIQEEPWHNQFSHTADAARTLGEAHLLGMIPMDAAVPQPPTVRKITIRRK